MPTFTFDQLRSVTRQVFTALGANTDEAEILGDFLPRANLVGHDSHGVIRIPQYIHHIKKDEIQLGRKVELLKETTTTAVINGNWGFGQVVTKQATDLAITKAIHNGLGCITVQQNNHVGRLSDYAHLIAERGCIGILMVNGHGSGTRVAPFGGIDGRFSTNPLCISIPQKNDGPIVADITTSVVAEGKVRVKRNRGEQLPPGWIIDANGHPSQDPKDFYEEPYGALLPLGGIVAHKGFALSMMVDILAGALSGAGCSGNTAPRFGNSVFILAIQVSNFVPESFFHQQIRDLIEWVKSSRCAPGFDEILVPGEPEQRIKAEREKNGIPIDSETWSQIFSAGQKLGLDFTEAENCQI
ncbi:MAG: Ldh family oxidoreductase [Candidatus Poribacteria bacterium]|mgnify:FL=1|nr:Ldh family oxidoreductase [Candidatus Poribacteria bacterium]|tara:strand:+ start:348 stop:1415 length:1068 start_codon:yes stop_codon:yes gene_type:complete